MVFAWICVKSELGTEASTLAGDNGKILPTQDIFLDLSGGDLFFFNHSI